MSVEIPWRVLERSHGLTASQLLAIADLEARCRAVDGGRLKLEWGALNRRDAHQVNDLMWWEGEVLAGFCGRYSFGGQEAEATGMVDPEHRRHGIGTRLLEALRSLSAAHEDPSFLLVTPRESAGARRLAAEHGGTFDHAEHALVLTALVGDDAPDPAISLRRATSSDAAALQALLAAGFGRESVLVDFDLADEATLLAEREGRAIATMRVHFEEGTRGVYGFVVDPELQGRGIGRDLLRRVCTEALDEGVGSVHLEVAVDNDRALGLYTSIGFERVITEDYYRFAPRT